MTVEYEWRGDFDNTEVNALHAEGFDHPILTGGARCRWLHVDFEDHLQSFYVDACGFTPTKAGLFAL